ncbi:hypothetical protein CRUP_016399 [Coryphaenoides rupestris]|nr:hypothetical protein CRUP_016399 [Coryphaenoides rupestris]
MQCSRSQMSSAEEKLYNGYLRTNMAAIATHVKAREIVPHLPCLTLSDREEIEAKRENNGNFNAMQLLLDCLCRWERWPEQFIAALEACEHVAIIPWAGLARFWMEGSSTTWPMCSSTSSCSAKEARLMLFPENDGSAGPAVVAVGSSVACCVVSGCTLSQRRAGPGAGLSGTSDSAAGGCTEFCT